MSSEAPAPAPAPVLAGTSRFLNIGLAKQTGRNSCYAATASAAYNFVSPPGHKITEREVCKYVAAVKKKSSKNASPQTTEIEDPIIFLQGHHAFSSSIAPTTDRDGEGQGRRLCGMIKYEIDHNTPILMLLGEHYVTVVGYRVNLDCESDTAISPTVFDILIGDPDPSTKSDYWYNLGTLTKYDNAGEPRITASDRKKLSEVRPAVVSSVGQSYRGIVLLEPPAASTKPLSPSAARDKYYSPSPTSPKKTKARRSRASGAATKLGGRGGSRSHVHKRSHKRSHKYSTK